MSYIFIYLVWLLCFNWFLFAISSHQNTTNFLFWRGFGEFKTENKKNEQQNAEQKIVQTICKYRNNKRLQLNWMHKS